MPRTRPTPTRRSPASGRHTSDPNPNSRHTGEPSGDAYEGGGTGTGRSCSGGNGDCIANIAAPTANARFVPGACRGCGGTQHAPHMAAQPHRTTARPPLTALDDAVADAVVAVNAAPRRLNLARHALASLWPSATARLASLEALDLSHNRLVAVTAAALAPLVRLASLSLAHNRL